MSDEPSTVGSARTVTATFDVPDNHGKSSNALVEAVLEMDIENFLPDDFARNLRSVDTDSDHGDRS